jgi:hypothetical protein
MATPDGNQLLGPAFRRLLTGMQTTQDVADPALWALRQR